MQPQLIKSTFFFQQLLSSRFRTLKERVVKTIMLLSLCHLFSLYNPNQVSDALFIPKASLYRHLNEVSLYQWQHLFVHIGCSVALQEIRDAELKSASTRSRKYTTISVDDTHNPGRKAGLFSFRLFVHFIRKVAIRRSLGQRKLLD